MTVVVAVAKGIQRWRWWQHGQIAMTVAMAAQTTIQNGSVSVDGGGSDDGGCGGGDGSGGGDNNSDSDDSQW